MCQDKSDQIIEKLHDKLQEMSPEAVMAVAAIIRLHSQGGQITEDVSRIVAEAEACIVEAACCPEAHPDVQFWQGVCRAAEFVEA